jgi:SPP1 family predicted phage head-tail adaptor
MICDDVIQLVQENPAAHGVFSATTETTTTCFCRVQSVARTEFYRALENGIEPQFVFTLSEYVDYNGEKIVIYKNKRYRVVRTYVYEHSVELTVEEATADA